MTRETRIWIVLLVVGGAFLLFRTAGGNMGRAYVETENGVAQTAHFRDTLAGTAEVSLPRTIGLWLAAFFTLCIFSFLYRDNPFYKLAEAIVVGVSAAYWMVVAFWTTLIPNLLGKLYPAWIQSWAMPGLSPVRDPEWYWYWIPLVLGIMLLWRLSPRGAWIARWPLAFVIGATAGVRLIGYLQADFVSQIHNGIIPLVVIDGGKVDVWMSIKNVVLVLGTLAGLVYFFFSIEHKGVVGATAKVGIWVLMITFGAMFGYTVMGRIALLAARLEFLFDDWLWIIDPALHRLGM